MNWLSKPFRVAIVYGFLLAGSFSYSLLKTFVLAEAVSTVETTATTLTATEQAAVAAATSTDTSYQDDNISIQLTTETHYNTQVYIADIEVSDASYLKTALAQDTYGTNITAKTSDTAASHQAILAVNGDYYGANSTGYVIKNGILYRDTIREDSENGDLAIYADGSFGIIYENQISAQELIDQGVQQLLAFGPSLVENGEISVDTTTEVGQAMASNPRSAIGFIEEADGSLHYLIVVSDGRTSESAGLTLYQLAEILQAKGATTAYNLDGGGSSTLYFNGQVVNKPTTRGTISERAVSDIVYIGYH